MPPTGFILLHRSLLGHSAFRNESETMAFAWMIARASWQPTKVRYKGQAVTLARGELCISQRDMADAFDRDRAWIDRLWKRLERETMIVTRREPAATVVTICNYDKFQVLREGGEPADEPVLEPEVSQQRASNEPQNNEGNKGNKAVTNVTAQPTKRGTRLRDDWKPDPLPAAVAAFVAQWPPGREQREQDQFRDYWTSRTKDAAKLDWEKTWHNRIRDQHDRIMREANGGSYRNGSGAGGRAEHGFTSALREAEASGWGADVPR